MKQSTSDLLSYQMLAAAFWSAMVDALLKEGA